MAKTNFKARVLKAKQAAITALAARGITDKFTVRVKKLPNLTAQENWLGMYRHHSQFMERGTIFWVNEALPSLIEGVDVPEHDVLVDTLLHEYAHVIFEFAREMSKHKYARQTKRFWEDIKALQTGPDDEFEEEFAESMGQTLGSGHLDPVYAELAERYAELLDAPDVL